jgi:predicted nucleic acid-binding protein
MNAFYDTNVLLDVLLKREPFYEDSARTWALAEKGRLRGYVAVISLVNVFYMVDRLLSRKAAGRAVRTMLDIFVAVGGEAQLMSQAVDSDLPDFEDGVQYFSALRADADCILTRDAGHFPQRPAIPVISPTEFLAQLEAE